MSFSLKNAVNKLIIYPFKYKNKDDYDAETYWRDRFQKYGDSLKGVGNEGLSDKENRKVYEGAKKVITEMISALPIEIEKTKVLEIGSGVGFYTDYFNNELYIEDLTAMDITDHYFPELKTENPSFQFVKRDISTDDIDGTYDVIFMIDVIEHIVKDEKFRFALANIQKSLKPGGYFIITGYKQEQTRKRLFYVKSWSKEDILTQLKDLKLIDEKPFRRTYIMILKNG